MRAIMTFSLPMKWAGSWTRINIIWMPFEFSKWAHLPLSLFHSHRVKWRATFYLRYITIFAAKNNLIFLLAKITWKIEITIIEPSSKALWSIISIIFSMAPVQWSRILVNVCSKRNSTVIKLQLNGRTRQVINLEIYLVVGDKNDDSDYMSQ